jgi:hypothetical protein
LITTIPGANCRALGYRVGVMAKYIFDVGYED